MTPKASAICGLEDLASAAAALAVPLPQELGD